MRILRPDSYGWVAFTLGPVSRGRWLRGGEQVTIDAACAAEDRLANCQPETSPMKVRRMLRNIVPRLGIVAFSIAALALMTAGSATADSVETKDNTVTIAAADGAGWLLFKGHRSSRSDELAPSSVSLDRVADPKAPHSSADDALNRSGASQASSSAR